MDVYARAIRGYMQRCSERISISTAKIKFLEDIWSMYEDGLLTRDEWRELFEMV